MLITMEIRGDGSYQTEEFKIASQNLLPNENLRFVAAEKEGFMVLSDRRFAYLKKGKEGYWIKRISPLDVLITCEHKKKDTWKIRYHDTNPQDGMIRAKMKKGSVEYSITDRDFKQPSNTDTEVFRSAMMEFNLVLAEIQNSSPYTDGRFQPRDYSHLHRFITTPDEKQILLLNTILEDKPESNELLGASKKLLEGGAYMLWNETQYILFAVGKNLCLFIDGVVQGGLIHYLNVVRFDPKRILNMITDWMWRDYVQPQIQMAVSRYSDGGWQYSNYLVKWTPKDSEPRWLVDPANQIWIISDMIFDKQQELVKANFATEDPIDDPKVRRQRYFW